MHPRRARLDLGRLCNCMHRDPCRVRSSAALCTTSRPRLETVAIASLTRSLALQPSPATAEFGVEGLVLVTCAKVRDDCLCRPMVHQSSTLLPPWALRRLPRQNPHLHLHRARLPFGSGHPSSVDQTTLFHELRPRSALSLLHRLRNALPGCPATPRICLAISCLPPSLPCNSCALHHRR